MKTVAGVHVYLTQNPDEAFDQIEGLNICRNCVQFKRESLFDFKCKGIEDGEEFNLSSDDSCCEYFNAKDLTVEYWISKLCGMKYEYEGHADFDRQLKYHQEQGTDWEFLGFKKP
ncbi:hypothetical protein [Chryseobacterium gambrini]|uniref:hypothetical protein n=1 Tax=Chryseobacterium gambrini TaxID=373672 RepID=UPI003D0D6541